MIQHCVNANIDEAYKVRVSIRAGAVAVYWGWGGETLLDTVIISLVSRVEIRLPLHCSLSHTRFYMEPVYTHAVGNQPKVKPEK